MRSRSAQARGKGYEPDNDAGENEVEGLAHHQVAIEELLMEQERKMERAMEMLEAATADNRRGLEAAVDMLGQGIDRSLMKLKGT